MAVVATVVTTPAHTPELDRMNGLGYSQQLALLTQAAAAAAGGGVVLTQKIKAVDRVLLHSKFRIRQA
jgi:hypothetical protein